jgi:N-acetylmuramoyl-L-alanine amidase
MSDLAVAHRPLPYETRLEPRDPATIDLVVIHCTELPDLATARRFGEEIRHPASGCGNAGHYYVDRDGSVELWVALDRVAHHVRGYNARSVGIELVNLGRYPDWLHSQRQQMSEAYAAPQIEALLDLLTELRGRLPTLRWITGHEDLDTGLVAASDDPALQVRRKRDPGPLFPWARVLGAVPLERLLP